MLVGVNINLIRIIMSRAIAPLQVPTSERFPPLNPDRRWQITDFVFDRAIYTVVFGWSRFVLFLSTCIVLSCQLIDIADGDVDIVLQLKDAELNTKHVNNALNVLIGFLCLSDAILTPDDIWNNYEPSQAYSYLTRIPKNVRIGMYMTAISGFSAHKFNMWISNHNDAIETELYQNFTSDYTEKALVGSRAFLLVGGCLCLLVGLVLPDDTIYDEEYWGSWGKRWYEKSSYDATERKHRVMVPFHEWALLVINWMMFGFKAVIPTVGMYFHYHELMENWDDTFIDDFYHNSEVSYTTGQISMLAFGGALLVDATFSLLSPFGLLQNVNEPQNYRPLHFWVMFMHWYYTTTVIDYKGQDPTDGEDYVAVNRVFSICLLICYVFQEVFIAPATSNSRLNDRRIRNGKPPIRVGLNNNKTWVTTPFKTLLRFQSLIKLDALQNLIQAVAVALGTFSLVLFMTGYLGPWLRLHPSAGDTTTALMDAVQPAVDAAIAVENEWSKIKNSVISEISCDFDDDDEGSTSAEATGLIASIYNDIEDGGGDDGEYKPPSLAEFNSGVGGGAVTCTPQLTHDDGSCLVVFGDGTYQSLDLDDIHGTCPSDDPTFPSCFTESEAFIGTSSHAGNEIGEALYSPNPEADALNNFARAGFPTEQEIQCRDRNCKIILGVTAATLATKAAAVATSWIPFVSAASGAAEAIAEAAEITARVVYETVRFIVRTVLNVRKFLSRLGLFKLAQGALNAFNKVYVPALVKFEYKILYGYVQLYITGFISFGFGFWRRARMRRADYNDLFNVLLALMIGIAAANIVMTFVMYYGPEKINELLAEVLPENIVTLTMEEREGYVLIKYASICAMVSSILWLVVMILEKLEDVKEFVERLVFGGKGNRFDQSGYKLQARHMPAENVENISAMKSLALTVKEPRYRDNAAAWLQSIFWCLAILFIAYPDWFPADGGKVMVFFVERDSNRHFTNMIFDLIKGVAMSADAGSIQGDHNNLCDVIGELVKKGIGLVLKSFLNTIGFVIPGLTDLGDELYGMYRFLSNITSVFMIHWQTVLMTIVYSPTAAFFVLLALGIAGYILRVGNTVSVWVRYMMLSVATYGIMFLLTLQVYADMLNGLNIPIVNYNLVFTSAIQHSMMCCFLIFLCCTHWYFDRVFPLYGALRSDGPDYDAFQQKLQYGESVHVLESTGSIHSLLEEQPSTSGYVETPAIKIKNKNTLTAGVGPLSDSQKLTLSTNWFTQ